jgi:hypothetical protein
MVTRISRPEAPPSKDQRTRLNPLTPTSSSIIVTSQHRIPRWMNALWRLLVFRVFREILFFVVGAFRHGCDFVQIIGFVPANRASIFGIAVVAGLVLCGLSILLEGIEFHKSHCDKDDHSGDMANLVP